MSAMAQFLKNFLREREIADVYAWQGSWDEVWQQYDQNVATTQRDRPISGSSRFRLRAVVAAWRKKLQISASEGTQPVTAHFKNGIKYLYGFDCTEFVPYKKKGSSILPLDKCEHLTLLLGQLKQKPFASTEKVDYFYFADNHIIVAVGKKRLPGPSEEYPILLLKKEGAERVIESKEREELQTDIEQFFFVYHVACEHDYDERIGLFRKNHINAIDAISLEMSSGRHAFPEMLSDCARKLVSIAKNHRVLISLVNPQRDQLLPAASACQPDVKDFCGPLIHDIGEEALAATSLDIQPYVVKTRSPCCIPDALSWRKKTPTNNKEQAKLLGINAFVVVPMLSEENVVEGTIHFERNAQKIPSKEEIELYESIAKRLVAFIVHKKRESLLEQALHAIDEPIRVLNVFKQICFVNQSSAKLIGAPPGWQPSLKTIPLENEDDIALYEEILTKYNDTSIRYDIPNENQQSHKFATKKNLSKIRDFNFTFDKNNATRCLGVVEHISNLHNLYSQVKLFDQWIKIKGVHETARAILDYFKKRSFSAERIFLYEKSGENSLLRSYLQDGIKNTDYANAFERGAYVIKDSDSPYSFSVFEPGGDLAIFEHNPTIATSVERTKNLYGLPHFYVKDLIFQQELEKRVNGKWIEAPLRVGDKIIGKLVLEWAEENVKELKWGLLRMTVAIAATVLYEKMRSEKVKEVARGINYALRTKVGLLENALYNLKQVSETPQQDALLNLARTIHFFKRGVALAIRRFDPNLVRELKAVELVSLIERVLPLIDDERIETNFPAGPIQILGDNQRLEDLVLELLVNARDFTPSKSEDGRIVVSLSEEAEEVVIAVADNGPGILDDFREDLFEEFTCHPANRMGLGLNYVRKITEGHSGWVEEIGMEGKGAHFLVHFPNNQTN